KIQNETLLNGGSDLYIRNWQSIDPNVLEQLKLYSEIESMSNITVYQNHHGSMPLFTLVYNNLDDYLSTSFQPPKYILKDWKERVQESDEPNTMMVSRGFFIFVAKEKSNYTFSYSPNEYTFDISSTFSFYPIFNTQQDSIFTNEYYFVTNMNNYKKLNESTQDYLGYSIDRLLIKLKPSTNQVKFAEQIEKELNINVESTEEEADIMLIRDFPFYSLMSAEFVFGILICLIAIIFTSLSNPIKILQRRITKHDVLKKIGIPSNSIILITGLELLISAILPGLILGGVAGYGLVRLTGYLMLSFTYSSIPFVIPYPFPAMLLIFLGIPVMFYTIFFVAMKINFVRFRPRNLE
ncbi:MAG: hypothetical protein H7645_08440, partial [Candidatus Heimdallarchaeota archaeon]|nr:hypothetical protein [Candidatus Heimdallarchaeota archaeon]MCK4770353.1 hypothetical protein [Candidatus Heimdallarchaeota archaeon]